MSDSLKTRRGIKKAAVTRFKTYLDQIKIDKTLFSEDEFNQRFNKFSPLLSEFEIIQDEIEIADPGEIDSEERINFEKAYYTTKKLFNSLSVELKTPSNIHNIITSSPIDVGNSLSLNTSNNGDNAASATVHANDQLQHRPAFDNRHLPPIVLPHFNGDTERWLEFKDKYTSIIHNDSNLPDVQKMFYLLSCCKGEAFQCISNLEVTSANYPIAWNCLINMYENKRLIIENHIKTIFDIPKIVKESASDLRSLHNTITRHLAAITSFDIDTKQWDPMLVVLITTRLDPITRRDWEMSQAQNDNFDLTELIKFIDYRAKVLITLKKSDSSKSKPIAKSQSMVTCIVPRKCLMCEENHELFKCPSFALLSPKDRFEKTKSLKVCINCFRKGHFSKNCNSRFRCLKCKAAHHTLLHFEQTSESAQDTPVSTVCAFNHKMSLSSCLLPTAQILICNGRGQFLPCNALLDSASQSNLITTRLADQIVVKRKPVKLSVSGIALDEINISSQISIKIKSRLNDFSTQLQCLIIPNITSNIPSESFNADGYQIPPEIQLADPDFNVAKSVDILLGAGIFWELLSQGQIRLRSDEPILQNTLLGWVISGNLMFLSSKRFCHVTRLDAALTKFWNVEEIPKCNETCIIVDNDKTEQHFQDTTSRDNNGRFVVKLPFKTAPNCLGLSLEIATKRFYHLERKLRSNSTLMADYEAFIDEYIALGHMSKVSPEKLSMFPVYYLPHHSVMKSDSTTTKLRVVFDASAATSNGISLNDLLETGPNIQNDIFEILTRFSTYKYVITADVAKMYRQISLHPDHRAFQRILWRSDQNQEIDHYELNTVTYGMASSAFLSVRCLRELANQFRSRFPKECHIIDTDFYVDDLLTGASSVDEILSIKQNMTAILEAGCFPLRKWYTNVNIESYPSPSSEDILDFNTDPTKTLGMCWNPSSDCFSYSIRFPDKVHAKIITKRTILSQTAAVFDPLGLIAPIVIKPKILLQRLWQLKLSWDESVPLEIQTKWQEIKDSIALLPSIKIPRFILSDDPLTVELHAFCDSSEAAYGACVYLRSVCSNGNISVRLLAAKSRVAPLKRLTIPRLELCGALLLSRLVKCIRNCLTVSIEREIYWTDSQIVLAWLNTCPSKLKTFVSHRVSKIQQDTDTACWRHVPGINNPADIVSRGVNTNELIASDLWWNAPRWLSLPEGSWPQCQQDLENRDGLEEKRVTLLSFQDGPLERFSLFDLFSSFPKLLRVTAYLLRFYNHCLTRRSNTSYDSVIVTSTEMTNSLNVLIKIVQAEMFGKEVKQLKASKTLSPSSPLLKLNPFIDVDGILRVGGRLVFSKLNEGQKHPIVLPYKHPFSHLLARYEHFRLCHAGAQATLNSLRQNYWIISGRRLVRNITRSCIACFKVSPRSDQPCMAELPDFRVNPSRPFAQIGTDYAGPFLLKTKNGRGAKCYKAYICLFVCLATKALHIELVTGLSTDAFLATFKRFMSRRGRPQKIYSDNGTNFIGANNEIKALYNLISKNNEIEQFMANEFIEWHFIPARAPHFGGIWESAVRIAKLHLKRTIGESKLTFEDMYTILVQIEACMNSRPLSPLSNDPNDYLPLTPAHFLIGQPITSLPDSNIIDIPCNRLNHYKRLQQLLQMFWRKWQREYLNELQARSKWRKKNPARLKEGDLIIMKEDNLPPLSWKMGRITKFFPGRDGITRVAEISLNGSTLRRPINQLCPLPTQAPEEVEDNDLRNN